MVVVKPKDGYPKVVIALSPHDDDPPSHTRLNTTPPPSIGQGGKKALELTSAWLGKTTHTDSSSPTRAPPYSSRRVHMRTFARSGWDARVCGVVNVGVERLLVLVLWLKGEKRWAMA